MAVWNIAPVAERPQVTLVRWRVVEVPGSTPESPRVRHLVGHSLEDRQGQVSSAVQSWDPNVASAVTRSGRVYRLHGMPGSDGDGDYTWSVWKRINGVTQSWDVSRDVFTELQLAQSGGTTSLGHATR
jgi:hypothetical protein